jgi:hypothetical protein
MLMMRTLAAVALVLLGGAGAVADPPVPKDAPAKDVELTIKASAATTTLLKDGTNANLVKLTLTFKNVSKRELKLGATGLSSGFPLVTLEVVGPDDKPVTMKEHRRVAPGGVRRNVDSHGQSRYHRGRIPQLCRSASTPVRLPMRSESDHAVVECSSHPRVRGTRSNRLQW